MIWAGNYLFDAKNHMLLGKYFIYVSMTSTTRSAMLIPKKIYIVPREDKN